MLPKFLLLLSACVVSSAAIATAQVAPAAEAPKWQLFAEAGPKTSWFENVTRGSTVLVPAPGSYVSEYYRDFQVDNTYAAFADVIAFRPLTKHRVASGSTGLDMQQLDFTTTTRSATPPFRTSPGEHVVRLLTRVRVDAGLHLALGLGRRASYCPASAWARW